MKRNIAVFDFDGTLTTKDTLLEFIKFACGRRAFYWGFLLYSPILVLMKLHLYTNWKAKEKIFSYFFKGMDYERFCELGRNFSSTIDSFKKDMVAKKLEKHLKSGDTVYVISASIEEWVRPWCEKYKVTSVLGTMIDVDNQGIITGRFLSKNCYGQEKVNRLLEVEPHRSDYFLYAYGDSRGDKEMIDFADKGIYVD